MTTWDKIYKNYQKGGLAWKSLSEEIIPQFKRFIEKTNFPRKKALDIGCGDGRYLKYLEEKGFETDGIDSSETSVELTKKILKNDSKIEIANMFEYEIPADKYDFIFSVNTIQHGRKEEARALIKKVYKSLIKSGKIFFTLPDESRAKKWQTFKKSKKVAAGTFIPLTGLEKGLPHSFFRQEEIREYFKDFNNLKMRMDERGKWLIQAEK